MSFTHGVLEKEFFISEQTKGLLFACTTALMWGVLAIFLKFALKVNSTFTIVWIRFLVAFILLFVFLYLYQPNALNIKPLLKPLPIVAVFGLAFNYWAFLKGVEYTSPTNAQIIIQIGPMLLALLGIFYFGEKLRRFQQVGILFFVLGFIFFYLDQHHLAQALAQNLDYDKGSLWIFFAALAWAVYAFVQKKILTYSHPQTLNLVINGFCAIVFLPFVDFNGLGATEGIDWAVLFFLGLNTFLAYGGMTEAMKRIPANQVSVIITLNPLITIFVMLMLKRFDIHLIPYENLGLKSYLGAFFIVVGAILVVSRARSLKAAKIEPK